MDPVVFLDRDNTLIDNSGDLGDPSKVQLLAGVAEGLKRLKDAGFRLVVVTNQGGVARGRYSESDVDKVHARIAQLVDEGSGGSRVIDRFYYCPFHPDGTHPDYRREHPWRKPQPGMLLQAASDLALDLDRGWMIGDHARDIIAGRAAGCRTVLIGRDPAVVESANPEFVGADFLDAVDTVLWHRMNDSSNAQRRSDDRAKSAVELKPKPGATPSASSVAAMPRTKGKRKKSKEARRGAKPALEPLRRALVELVEEVRNDRTRRDEFGPLRLAAAATQLLTVVIAVFAMLELSDLQLFARWMAAAVLAQLATIALLLFDSR